MKNWFERLEKGESITFPIINFIPEEAKALEDINLCIAHFFHESNIRVNEDSFPEVKIMSNTLGFSMTQEDPNENVNFL